MVHHLRASPSFVSVLLAGLVLLPGCGRDERPLTDTAADTEQVALSGPWLRRVAADPAAGFHYPYLLAFPASLVDTNAPRPLLVQPNNTGTTSDDLRLHDRHAERLLRLLVSEFGEPLRVPVLVPVFPRPASRERFYTHALDRDCLREREGELARLDLQLAAMIDHARGLLGRSGLVTAPQVLLSGFSASGSFVNRFTALHPERVLAVAAGGLNALPILPLAELDGRTLGYPLGVADFDTLVGRPFAQAAWAAVPQLVFMGELDENDTLPYDDAWDGDERATIVAVLGERMQPGRWHRVQGLLRESGADVRCVTYFGIGHEWSPAMRDDLCAFFTDHGAEYAAP